MIIQDPFFVFFGSAVSVFHLDRRRIRVAGVFGNHAGGHFSRFLREDGPTTAAMRRRDAAELRVATLPPRQTALGPGKTFRIAAESVDRFKEE